MAPTQPTTWNPATAVVDGNPFGHGTEPHQWCGLPPEWAPLFDGLALLGYTPRVAVTRDPRTGTVNGVLIGRRPQTGRAALTDLGRTALDALREGEEAWDGVDVESLENQIASQAAELAEQRLAAWRAR
jgi:hypothetical protein